MSWFLVYRPFTSFVKFILRYFILWDAVVSEIVFLTLLIVHLLVYRNAKDFCMLIFLSCIFNLLITSNNYLVESLGFSIENLLSAHGNSFTSSFLIWMAFFPLA